MSPDPGHPLRVGIDGPCGAGETTLAVDLASEITSRGASRVSAWDEVIYLDVTTEVAQRRGVRRDASALGAETAAYAKRACQIYIAEKRRRDRRAS
jgi:thymidylate kinase